MLEVIFELFFAERSQPVHACAAVAFENLHDKPFFGIHEEWSFRSGVNQLSGVARADRERITRVGPQNLPRARNARDRLQDVVQKLLIRATSRIESFLKLWS